MYVKFIILSFIFSCSVFSAELAKKGDLLEISTKEISLSNVHAMEQDIQQEEDIYQDRGCFGCWSRCFQNCCYQMLAATCWDSIMGGFNPGRIKAMTLLDIQPMDKVLLVGEGSGLDFNVLPDTINKNELKALDFSSEMVRQAKQKAPRFGIPEENCFVGDAQKLPFTEERFDKIFFPLSLGSIPDPTLALEEAERVLAPRGRIVIFEKLVDDHAEISCSRYVLNWFTRCIFADINRNLTHMMGHHSSLKIMQYESLENHLSGCLVSQLGPYYRLAVLVRASDYPDPPTREAVLRGDEK